jgi:hypothetical protein
MAGMLVYDGDKTPISKHGADSRSIEGSALFLRPFAVSFRFSPAEFAGLPHFSLDFHRAHAAD